MRAMWRRLTWTGRLVVVMLTVWSFSVAVTACSAGPQRRVVAEVVAHLEYVPASTHVEQECSGAVPMICNDRTVLEKQCWRVDVRTTYEELRRDGGYGDDGRFHAKGELYNALRSVCVFPSELAALKVGDPWVAPAVPYGPGPRG